MNGKYFPHKDFLRRFDFGKITHTPVNGVGRWVACGLPSQTWAKEGHGDRHDSGVGGACIIRGGRSADPLILDRLLESHYLLVH